MNSKVVIRRSPIHGKGVFAKRLLRRNSRIGVFEGVRTQEDGPHVLWIHDEEDGTEYGIDGRNELRFLNHSSEPNAEFRDTELYAIRTIRPDDEITFHYGEEWEDD